MKKEESKTHRQETQGIKQINKEAMEEILENRAVTLYLIQQLKHKLEANVGRIIEPLLKEGKLPKENKECHEAVIALAHLKEIEKYVNTL